MAVKYTVNERGNPLNPQQPKKWYANAKSTGDVTLRALGKEIAQRSTVSSADTQAVLVALTEVFVEHLAEGRIVRLGDFGAFQVNVSSEGAETEAKFNAAQIKGSNRYTILNIDGGLFRKKQARKFSKECYDIYSII